MPNLSVLATPDYTLETLRAVVTRHFALLTPDLRPGMRVVLKPNLIMRSGPQRAATTHPALAEAVILELHARGITDILIADSPGGLYTPQRLREVYQTSGFLAVSERTGVRCNLDCGAQMVRCEDAVLCKAFELIDPIVQADCVINLCKLKTHCMMTFSCAVKNLFGCIPGLSKPQLHYRFPHPAHFAQMLTDLSLLVRPSLTIVDAVCAMEGDGPTGGTPRQMGFTAAAVGADVYPLDLLMAELIGLTPDDVPLLAETIARGLCPPDLSGMTLCGDPPERFAAPDFKKPSATTQLNFSGNVPAVFRPVVNWLEPKLASRPVVRQAGCIGCGRCAESCPTHTIALKAGKAHILRENCIRCYCCHEMCPVKAIDVHTPAIFRFRRKRAEKGGNVG